VKVEASYILFYFYLIQISFILVLRKNSDSKNMIIVKQTNHDISHKIKRHTIACSNIAQLFYSFDKRENRNIILPWTDNRSIQKSNFSIADTEYSFFSTFCTNYALYWVTPQFFNFSINKYILTLWCWYLR
jgi:hypothetical protein